MGLIDQIVGILLLRYFKGYRSILVNVATIIVALSALSFYPALLTGPYAAITLLVMAVANAIIRFDTNTPVFSKTEEKVL